jgi:hypothetical protein
MRVVGVDVQFRMALQQRVDLTERSEIPEHRVEPVRDVPDSIMGERERFGMTIDLSDIIVIDGDDRDAQQLNGHMQTGMRELVDDDRVVVADQHWQGGQVRQCRGGRHQDGSAGDPSRSFTKDRITSIARLNWRMPFSASRRAIASGSVSTNGGAADALSIGCHDLAFLRFQVLVDLRHHLARDSLILNVRVAVNETAALLAKLLWGHLNRPRSIHEFF